MSQSKGVIAAGHQLTVQVAGEILKSGGNAFDAVVAAHLAACVTEPVLSSPAGGGFLLAQTGSGTQVLLDFFVHTPMRRRDLERTEFYPISADFGETTQEFHIGMGSFATPGTIKGIFAIHQDFCTMPMKELVQPAAELARKGVSMNHFQSCILDIVKPIFLATARSREIYGHPEKSGTLLSDGDTLFQPDLADFLEVLAIEGVDLFYRGEISKTVDQMNRDLGGHISRNDFESYEVIRRKPLGVCYRGSNRLAINPAPSSGGMLISLALKLMEEGTPSDQPFGSAGNLLRVAKVQQLTDLARVDYLVKNKLPVPGENILDPEYLEVYRKQYRDYAHYTRGTTQISIMDGKGNTASLTTSNGEGCGWIIPSTGIMLNNMLGEEDLHPNGFQQWPENTRISSMMAPAILNRPDGSIVALGSGGANRIRTAILQVLLNLTDYNMTLEQAVRSPRIHCEKDYLSIERGFEQPALDVVCKAWPNHKIWNNSNLFFGGAHSVMKTTSGFQAAGDPRRGGASLIVD